MKPILTPDEAGSLDRASRERGIRTVDLMEHAGIAVARAAVDATGGVYGRRAVVVCGKGNNAGDGLVAARHLRSWGMAVTVLAVDDPAVLREPAATNLRRLDEVDVRLRAFTPALAARELDRADVAIDALFGTGFRGVPENDSAEAIDALNASGVPIVAVDIPSGVDGTTGAVEGDAVHAAITVTLGALKPGLVLYPGAELAGLVRVADIGFPPDLVASDLGLLEEEDVAALLPVREPDTHKRATGVVLVVAGSRGMTGAVHLVAEAAYRAGAGLVNVAVPESVLAVVQASLVEATFVPLPETDEGTVRPDGLAALADRLDAVDAVAVGPGLTTDSDTAVFVRSLVRECPAPLVVDADALNAFTGRAVDLADRKADAVLTPHAGEFARLARLATRDVIADRVGRTRALAAETRAVVLLKGSRTVIASPDGVARVNPTGGPVLATGGSGDVLTGMIAALMARGLAPIDAASAGAYLHGIAGRLAGEEAGEGATAGDVLDRVPDSFLEVPGETPE